MLNRVFKDLRSGSDMDFLQGKCFQVVVSDIDVTCSLYFNQESEFVPADQAATAQVRISGDVKTFLMLATRREDADSLFFRRLLRMEGETATGLHLKNFLDTLDELPLLPAVQTALERFTDLYMRHCVGEEAPVQSGQFSRPRTMS